MFQWCSLIFEKVRKWLKSTELFEKYIEPKSSLSTWFKFPEKGIKTAPNIFGKGNAICEVFKNDVW